MKKAIGLISCNFNTNKFGDLADDRALASIPFGGRYRLIDFPLSNLTNSGIDVVGVIMPYRYRSIIDHIGDGREWSLGKKRGGLFVLPGTVYGVQQDNARLLMRDLDRNSRFLTDEDTEYVVICNCNVVVNINIEEIIKCHEESNRDVTMVYKYIENENKPGKFLTINEDGKISKIDTIEEGNGNRFLDIMVINKKYLLDIMKWYETLANMDITDIIMKNIKDLNVGSYAFHGYARIVDTIHDYMWVSMELLDENIRRELFRVDRPIITKVADEPPAFYTDASNVKNSIVASGCLIEGEVENSIIFRKVHIKKGAKVKNSIILQHGIVEEDALVERVICDKNATVSKGVSIQGSEEHISYIGKMKRL